MNECIICYKQLDKDDIKQVCGHIFHTKCITNWVLISDSCPICRSVLINKKKFKVSIEDFLFIYFKECTN